jgi:hypothetical protein
MSDTAFVGLRRIEPDDWMGPSYDLRGMSDVETMSEMVGEDVTGGQPYEFASLLSGPNDDDFDLALTNARVRVCPVPSCHYPAACIF